MLCDLTFHYFRNERCCQKRGSECEVVGQGGRECDAVEKDCEVLGRAGGRKSVAASRDMLGLASMEKKVLYNDIRN